MTVRARSSGPRAPTAPDPDKADLDALEELGDEIATLAAHIHAATHRLLVLIAAFDRRRGWKLDGHRSCAHWLAFRTGIDLGAAREKVRTARALVDLPETGASMARGELSFAKVRALTRVATAENESDLLDFARGSTAAELERMVRGWKLMGRADEAQRERVRHASRTFSVFPGDDGMYVVRGRLDPEVGALLMRAVEAAGDVLFRRDDGPSPRQRRADAVALLAKRALAAGFDGEGPMSGTRAERYQVVLHVELATLDRQAEPGMAELEDGTRVSAETSRRIACDAGLVRMTHARDVDGRGAILDVGRRTRTIPPSVRRALEARDSGCRFPGCGSRFTDAHHGVHWADGGATKLDNLILLCPYHHRLVHEDGYRVEVNPWPGGRPVFYDPRGTPVPERAKRFRGNAEILLAENRRRGVDPDWRTPSARWKREADVPDPVWVRAMEALGG